jgi:predicted PurR-regulated permease PerM
MIPLLGPYLIWIPVVIYLLIGGNSFSAAGLSIFGLIASSIDNVLRPLIVSRRTKLHSALVIVGMVGGLLIFGVLGLIIGPLILAYLLIVLEIYRNKKLPGIIVSDNKG